jgi:hypothetical protein
MYALKTKESKRHYPSRFKVFLDYLKLEGTINEQAKQFLTNTKRQSAMDRTKAHVFCIPSTLYFSQNRTTLVNILIHQQ